MFSKLFVEYEAAEALPCLRIFSVSRNPFVPSGNLRGPLWQFFMESSSRGCLEVARFPLSSFHSFSDYKFESVTSSLLGYTQTIEMPVQLEIFRQDSFKIVGVLRNAIVGHQN